MGSNISVNCFSTFRCPWAEFSILLNNGRAEGPLRPLNSSTVQLWLRDFRMPLGTVICLVRCPDSEKPWLVCGADILAGCESPAGFSVVFVKPPAPRRSGWEVW